MGSTTTSAPFTQAVVASMRSLYPEVLADRSFDNTGLLLEAPFDPARKQKHSVLLTVDLTKAVADEAIERQDSCIVAYHPIIFRGLKSLTLQDTQQQSLLRLAAAGISVYCPHTAIDAAPGGLGDWLADIVTGKPSGVMQHDVSSQAKGFQLEHFPAQSVANEKTISLGAIEHERYPIKKVNGGGVQGAGMGRVARFTEAVPLREIVKRISLALNNPTGIPIAIPQGKDVDEVEIKSVAVCAGSGGHLFAELEKDGDEVDLLFTGEMSHHEALAAIEKGKCVIALSHSNTERGFLHQVLRPQLEKEIKQQLSEVDTNNSDGPQVEHFEVSISKVDRDPYSIMVRR